MTGRIWTDADFSQMSWHDNHVHGMRIVETRDGGGDLILDVDHIVEWIKDGEAGFQFRILPVTLTFHEVMFMRISLDYATPTAAFGPFMIQGIERHEEQRLHHIAKLWKILVSWPHGELTFEGNGFTQRARGEPILSQGQCLRPEDRIHAA